MVALFVYGTLRTPDGGPAADTHFHSRISPWIRHLAPATLPGAQIFDLGSYPGVRRGSGEVVGELFEVDEAALSIADEIEGHPDFYVRQLEVVRLSDGPDRQAWVYWMPDELIGQGDVIESGDWFDRPRGDLSGTIEDQLLADTALVEERR